MPTKIRPPGRPTAGMRPGEKSSEYQRLTLRLPDDAVQLLKSIGRAVDKPGWRVMVDALQAYAGQGPPLSAEHRRAARTLLRLKP